MDEQDGALETSAIGISRCLRMLADEAESLNLVESVQAIRDAIRVCEDESRHAYDSTACSPARLN